MTQKTIENSRDPFDLIAQEIELKSPAFFRAVLLAPRDVRPKILIVIGLDMALYGAAYTSKEAGLSEIKLAWWDEAINQAQRNGHPVLEAIEQANLAPDMVQELVQSYRTTGSDGGFVVMMEIIARILGVDLQNVHQLMDDIAKKSHRARFWPKPMRPIVGMLVPLSRNTGWVKLSFLGWG